MNKAHNKFQYHLNSSSQTVAEKTKPKNKAIIIPITQPPQGPCANNSTKKMMKNIDLQ